MSMWRPSSEIRTKVLGIHWRDGKLLAAEVCDDSGQVKGVRPLGGTVEFGETLETALTREFMEELNTEVVLKGEPVFMENIYFHEGVPGHEILFLYEIELSPGAFDGEEKIVFQEGNGMTCIASWYDLNELDLEDGPALYPKGLKDHLIRSEGGGEFVMPDMSVKGA